MRNGDQTIRDALKKAQAVLCQYLEPDGPNENQTGAGSQALDRISEQAEQHPLVKPRPLALGRFDILNPSLSLLTTTMLPPTVAQTRKIADFSAEICAPNPIRPRMLHTDVAIVGGGLAGSLTAAMLGRTGHDAILVDPHTHYPPDFRCEKLDASQISAAAQDRLC